MKRRSLLIPILILISLTFTSCKMSEGYSKNDNQVTAQNIKRISDDIMDKGPVRGGTLKLFSTTPDTLNPVLTNNLFVQKFSNLMFESLVKLDKKQKPVPFLADRWEVSPDGTTWTFFLKDNILWHDNIALTAEDVEFTFETILSNNTNSPYKKSLQNIAAFAAVNRNTFRMVLKKPNSFTAEAMTFPILPKHYFSGEDVVKSARNMKPVGTGPYRFLSYTEGSEIKLAANDNWWNSKNPDKSAPNLPYIAEIVIKIYNNRNEGMNAFQTKDVDVTSIERNEFVRCSGRSDLTMKKFPGKNYDFVAFNLTKPALAEKSVRQAISYAVDKIKIVNDIVPGEAIVSDVPVIPDTWLYDTNIVSLGSNVAKAKEILAQNGWRKDGEYLYKFINGNYVNLQLEILVNEENDVRVKFAQKMSEQLKEIGVKLQVKKMTWEEEIRLVNTKKFDMVLMGCSVPSAPDVSFAYSSAEIATGKNVAGYSNPVVDKYLADILAENEPNRKKALFLNMKEIIVDDAPYIGMCFYDNAVIFNKRIRGNINPYLWDEFNEMGLWYIPVR